MPVEKHWFGSLRGCIQWVRALRVCLQVPNDTERQKRECVRFRRQTTGAHKQQGLFFCAWDVVSLTETLEVLAFVLKRPHYPLRMKVAYSRKSPHIDNYFAHPLETFSPGKSFF